MICGTDHSIARQHRTYGTFHFVEQLIHMPGKRAKRISRSQMSTTCWRTRSCTRNRCATGDRAALDQSGITRGEIANPDLGDGARSLRPDQRPDRAARRRSQERQRPVNSHTPRLPAALAAWPLQRLNRICCHLRARRPNDAAQHRRLVQPGVQNIGLKGCSSHSAMNVRHPAAHWWKGRRLAGADQLPAGHRSIQTTQRYIDGDSAAQQTVGTICDSGDDGRAARSSARTKRGRRRPRKSSQTQRQRSPTASSSMWSAVARPVHRPSSMRHRDALLQLNKRQARSGTDRRQAVARRLIG